MRYFKAIVEYDGTDFSGFQRQQGARTVQETLETAIEKRTEQAVTLACAGRTDAGVHGWGQVISFQAETKIPIESMAYALNSALPRDVTVRKAEEAEPSFHARFSASSRIYGYLILNRDTPSALWRRYSAFHPAPLEIEAMQRAGSLILGERDFASFTKERKPDHTTMREMLSCRVRRYHDFVIVRVEANAFLRGMVRNLVGTLLEVGTGKRSPESIVEILEAQDRRMAGPMAPPQGLCLLKVRYGERKDYTRREGKTEET